MLSFLRSLFAADAKPAVPRSPHWPAVRAAWLKVHPACAACGGTADLDVHHLRPVHLWPELELSNQNLLTLCMAHQCHARRGHGYDWGAYLPTAVEDSAHDLALVKGRRYGVPKDAA